MAHHRHNRRIGGKLTALLVILGILGAAWLFALWYFAYRPVFVLKSEPVMLEAGAAFDPWAAVSIIQRVESEEVLLDSGDLNTRKPGEYLLTYQVKNKDYPFTVEVKDTKAPELTVKEEVTDAFVGDLLSLNDFVLSCEDATEVEITFVYPEGSPQEDPEVYTCLEAGDVELTISAVDTSGNAAKKKVSVHIDLPDSEAPVISGAEDTVSKTGVEFDPMTGMTITDNLDPEPSVTVDAGDFNKDVPGTYTIRYTAADRQGNSSSAERNVVVADDVVYHDGTAFRLQWDASGLEGQPYLVAVNRAADTVTVYGKDESGNYTVPVRAIVCSTGPRTPTGYYRTADRYRWHYLFEDCWGQYAMRITGHIMFHSVPYHYNDPSTLEYEEYNLLGTPASLGCIRMCVEDIKWIYENCPDRYPCVLYDDAEFPGPLGKPVPLTIDLNDEARRGWDPTDPDERNPWRS